MINAYIEITNFYIAKSAGMTDLGYADSGWIVRFQTGIRKITFKGRYDL